MQSNRQPITCSSGFPLDLLVLFKGGTGIKHN